jgi:hypothetical protein
LDLSNSVRVLIESPFTERPKIEERTFLIEVRLEYELIRSVVHVLGLKLCIFELLSVRLHWRDWTELWLLTSATKST